MKQRNYKNIWKRSLGFLLTLSLLVGNSVQSVHAWSQNNYAQSEETESAAEEPVFPLSVSMNEQEMVSQATILTEITENRSEYSKEYLLSDQSRAVYVYPEAVHYETEKGTLEEIDNTLIETGEGYTNAANSYEVLITDNEDSRGEVIFQEEGYEISWQMVETIVEDGEKEVSTVSENSSKDVVEETDKKTPLLSARENETIQEEKKHQGTLLQEPDKTPEKEKTKEPQPKPERKEGPKPIAPSRLKAKVHHEHQLGTEKKAGEKTGKTKLPAGNRQDSFPEQAAEEPLRASTEEETWEVPEYSPLEEGVHEASHSTITFSGYENEVQVEYTPTGEGIKENIILPERESGNRYTFRVEVSGLAARVNVGNEVEFYEEATDEVMYYFPAPFMEDAKGEISYDAFYELITVVDETSGNVEAGNYDPLTENVAITPMEETLVYYLTIVLDETWLEKAAYPVVVDPVLKQNRGKNLKDSGGICSNGNVTNTLYVGKNSTGNLYRSFVRFDLPDMEPQSIVSKAMLYLSGTQAEEDTHYLTVSAVTEPWYHNSEETEGKFLSWEEQPESGKALDYHINAGSFNITKAVRQWMSGEMENYGLVFKAYNENKGQRATLKLKNSKTSPYLKITYRTSVGLENYRGYHTTGAGTAGTGYVQDYTGALTVVNSAVATAGNRFPMAITRVYNSNDTEEKGGWRFNYEQTLKVPTGQVDITTYPYVLTDEDGTTHYFKKGDVTYLENGESKTAKGSAALPSAKDEDGLKLFVVPVKDATLKEIYPLKLIDKSGSQVRYFDKMGRLGMITDSNQYENGKNSDTKEQNALTITLEPYGEAAGLEAFDAVVSSATALKELCSVSATTTDSEEYLALLGQLEKDMEVLKKDLYATSDYKTAKQVYTAVTKLADLTEPVSEVVRSTAKDRAEAILTAVKKAKEQAETLAEESVKRITGVTDAVGNKATFTYDKEGNVTAISDPTYEEYKETTYTYDEEGNLTEITFPDGKKAWYTYGEDHLLETAQDHDGYKVIYSYRPTDKRIETVEECHCATPEKPDIAFTMGQTYGITYGTDNTTVFRFSGVDDLYGNEDDIENVHVFDEQGRSVCVYSKKVGEDKVLGANAATYESETNSDGTENLNKRNKIKDTAVVGMHTNNLLRNHSFEYNDKSWSTYKNENDTPESGALTRSSESRRYLGEKSAYVSLAKRKKGVAGFKQEVKLTGGTYTFSGYCKTVNIEKASAYLKVVDEAGNTYYSNKITQETDIEFDNGWQRLDVTFTLPSGEWVEETITNPDTGKEETKEKELPQTVTVYLETDCGNETGAGNAAFDCVQLETGEVANDYNILEDGSFELTEEVLPYKATNYTEKTVKVEDKKSFESIDGTYSYHISGQPGRDKFLRFHTNLGSTKNSFVLSGWVKTESTPERKNRDMKVIAYHKEETEEAIITLKVTQDLSAYSDGWKYFTLILPAASWKDTTLTFRFYDNIGDLYIDGLQLTRNDVQTRKYDSEGRVTGKYTALKSTSSTHDDYNRLKSSTTPVGAKSTYSYSKTGDVSKVALDIGPDSYYTYDKYGNRLTTSTYDPDITSRTEAYTETSYTEDGNFIKSSTDSSGNVTSYEYNPLTGQLEKTYLPVKTTEETPVEVDYLYDEKDRITGVIQADRKVTYEYGAFEDLEKLNHNGFSYAYEYDPFGNVTKAILAGQEICRNKYNKNNGSHVTSIYPDGTETGKTYDEYGKVTSNSLDGQVMTKYVYDNDGNVARKTDVLGDITTKYDYNDSNLLVRSEVYAGDTTASEALESRMQYTYTKSGKVGTLSYQETGEDIRTYTYTYAKDEKPVKSTLPDKSTTEWSYDSLRRNTKIVHTPKSGAADSKKLNTLLTYKKVDTTTWEGETKKKNRTGLVENYTNKIGSTLVSKYHYTYDGWSNITKIETPDAAAVREYTYNDLGEVVRATETYENGTTTEYAYTYDAGGNIVTETIGDTLHTYAYDETWKDKLISYDGKAITYDVFGCPLNYMGSTMTWDIYGGLTSVKSGSDNITYTYMGDGQRRSKTVNGVTTTYHYNNGMLLSETTGEETLRYYYDSTGKVAEIVYKNGDNAETGYFFTRNAQGDIIAIYRSKDSKLMGTYEYDLWGKLISITPTENDTNGITEKNPLRYRSYYYDEETGFYYLKARYYDPEIRRFISADSMNAIMVAATDVSGKNLFTYAENNSVTNKDGSGNYVETVFDVISLANSIEEVYKNPTDPLAWACMAGDAADLMLPCVAGIGEGIRGAKTVAKIADKSDEVADAAKTVLESSKNTKDMYRAVGAGEYYDIMEKGRFRGIPGTLAAKEFGNDFNETLSWADHKINIDKVAIIKVTIPEETYNELNHMELDLHEFPSGTVTVEPDMLDKFNNSILNIEHVF